MTKMATSPTVEEMYHRTEEDSIGFTTLLKYENLHNAESMDMTPDESPKRISEGSSDDIHVCFACGDVITERFLLKVNDRSWHSGCLRCCMCHAELDRQTSCFIKADNVYCKGDYTRQFGTKCAKCLRTIQSNDWVRRAKDNVYHLACFACDSCKRQLSTGEEFALQDNKVLCKTHYVELLEGGSTLDSESSQRKSKRVRTTFTEEQVQVLQANFQLDSNPDGQDLERIAQITGLSKRVTQVWFQNSRARQKKYQNLKNTSNNSHTSRGHGGPGSPMSGIHGCNSYSCSDIDSSPGDWDSSLGTEECVINYSM